MVLTELGQRISKSLRDLSDSIVVDQGQVDKCLNGITAALFQADVDVHLVKTLRNNIKKQYCATSTHGNKRELVESLVVKELCLLFNCQNRPIVPIRGKRNVVMFVGIQ